MNLNQRSYSGRSLRPRPHLEEEKTTGTLIVATSWGGPELAVSVTEFIRDQLALNAQPEATRFGAFATDLGDDVDRLRASLVLANERVFQKENSTEWTAAVEVALLSVQRSTLNWAQIGSPHLLLQTNKGLQPLASTPDWSWQLQQEAPLVAKGLGLERTCYPSCGSYRFSKDEKVILISRAAVPASVYTLTLPDLNHVARAMVEDQPEVPFWLGVLEL
jgi:hypothetical protein